MSIEERVKKVVAEQLDVSGDIDNNASFIDDLGADSLTLFPTGETIPIPVMTTLLLLIVIS